MDELRRNTIVGLFMVVALVSLALLMSSFGELPAFLGGGEYEVNILVKDPVGIGEGTEILLSGVLIGRVKSVHFKDPAHLDQGVLVVGAISEEYVIPQSAWAEIKPKSLGIGRGEVNIRVAEGDYKPLPEGEEIPGVVGSPWGGMIPETLLESVERSVAQFGNFAEALTPVANDLHVLFERHTVESVDNPVDEARRLTANLSTVIERFDQSLKTFNETFGDPEVKAGWLELFANVKQMSIDGREALENIRSTTADLRVDLKRISTKLESGIDDTNQHIEAIAAEARPMLEHSAKLAASLLRLSYALEEGEGTVGRILKDPKLYESMLLTSQRLTDLIDTLQRMFTKFERDGAIGINAATAIGPIRKNIAIPDSAG